MILKTIISITTLLCLAGPISAAEESVDSICLAWAESVLTINDAAVKYREEANNFFIAANLKNSEYQSAESEYSNFRVNLKLNPPKTTEDNLTASLMVQRLFLKKTITNYEHSGLLTRSGDYDKIGYDFLMKAQAAMKKMIELCPNL